MRKWIGGVLSVYIAERALDALIGWGAAGALVLAVVGALFVESQGVPAWLVVAAVIMFAVPFGLAQVLAARLRREASERQADRIAAGVVEHIGAALTPTVIRSMVDSTVQELMAALRPERGDRGDGST